MALEWEQVVVDAADPVAGPMVGGCSGVGRGQRRPGGVRDPARAGPAAWTPVRSRPGAEDLKNRLHLDFRPDDQDAAVARLLDLGARHADVGQGEQSWIVLSDPKATSSVCSRPVTHSALTGGQSHGSSTRARVAWNSVPASL